MLLLNLPARLSEIPWRFSVKGLSGERRQLSNGEVGIRVPETTIAYVAQGKLHLRRDSGEEAYESEFGRSLRDRAAQIERRHSWKMQGRGAQFMSGVLWPVQAGMPAASGLRLPALPAAELRQSCSILWKQMKSAAFLP